jgi:membrane-associated protease RseP (regulator of RpoE activity)
MEDALAPPREAPDWRRSPLVNVLLLAATVATTTFFNGAAFSLALVSILFTHEMGHWLYARAYRVDATLPYFIPVPFGVGTLGAVIRMRGVIPSRRAALDIGASGPLAGFAIAVPLLLWGLAHSEVVTVAAAAAAPDAWPSSPAAALWRLMQGLTAFPDGAADRLVLGDSLVLLGAQRLLFGALEPTQQVLIHPVGFAAWVGLLVTALNLVPAGQLDGGHVIYALLGRSRARAAARLVSWALLAAGLFVSWTWLVWWALSRFVVGLGHPAAAEEEPLGPGRRAVAWLALAVFVLTFVPVPVSF